MAKLVGLKNLCTPALIYLIISSIAIVIMAIQNYNSVNVYCLGNFSCKTSISTFIIFIIKIIYVLFWTWILNLICNAGMPQVAWFLLLLPYILLFILIALLMFS